MRLNNYLKIKKSTCVPNFLLLSTLCVTTSSYATINSHKITAADCPLNSRGNSLANTNWYLSKLNGKTIPTGLKIHLNIKQKRLSGFSGCNNYKAKFHLIGDTRFRIDRIDQTNQHCGMKPVITGKKAININDWESSYLRTLMRMSQVKQRGNELHFLKRNGTIGMIMQRGSRVGFKQK